MSLNQYAVEDSDRKPKAPDDPTLSVEGKKLAKRIRAAHQRWLEVSRWGIQATQFRKACLTHQEQLAVVIYERLRLRLTWPVWSVLSAPETVTTQMRDINGSHRRIKHLVPDAFAVRQIGA